MEATLESRGLQYRLVETEGVGHAAELALQCVEQGEVERILVAGGDGTLHEVANGLLATGPREDLPVLAVLPVGTGNDFHRMVGGDRRVESAVALLETGRVRRFDVGRVRWDDGERYFVNLMGVGIDVELLKRRRAFERLPGLLQYFAALASALAHFDPLPLRVVLEPGSDGCGAEGPGSEVMEARSMLSAITVGPSVGGGFLLSPGAVPEDGLLDLCFVEAMGPFAIAKNLPKVLRGTHGSAREVRLRRLKRACVAAPDRRPLSFELDGELVSETTRSLSVEVVPGVLPVLRSPTDSDG